MLPPYFYGFVWLCWASVLLLGDRSRSHPRKVPSPSPASEPWLPAVLEKRALGPPCGTLAPQPRIHGFFSLLGRHAVIPDRLPPLKRARGLSLPTNPFAYTSLQFLWVDCIAVRPSFLMFVLFCGLSFIVSDPDCSPFFTFFLISVLVGSGHYCTSTLPNFFDFCFCVLFCFWFSALVTAKCPTRTGRRPSPAPNLRVLPW